jgi:hypothetical protein
MITSHATFVLLSERATAPRPTPRGPIESEPLLDRFRRRIGAAGFRPWRRLLSVSTTAVDPRPARSS